MRITFGQNSVMPHSVGGIFEGSRKQKLIITILAKYCQNRLSIIIDSYLYFLGGGGVERGSAKNSNLIRPRFVLLSI